MINAAIAIFCFGFAFLIAILWVTGIDHMAKNHPDYKGLDLFDEDDDEKS